ncbi:hypothetical protein OAK59_02785, partial [Akkermansiaceae bacterium]|nr:hypothetical protein [Akkermansiaceae bacterium]
WLFDFLYDGSSLITHPALREFPALVYHFFRVSNLLPTDRIKALKTRRSFIASTWALSASSNLICMRTTLLLSVDLKETKDMFQTGK